MRNSIANVNINFDPQLSLRVFVRELCFVKNVFTKCEFSKWTGESKLESMCPFREVSFNLFLLGSFISNKLSSAFSKIFYKLFFANRLTKLIKLQFCPFFCYAMILHNYFVTILFICFLLKQFYWNKTYFIETIY